MDRLMDAANEAGKLANLVAHVAVLAMSQPVFWVVVGILSIIPAGKMLLHSIS